MRTSYQAPTNVFTVKSCLSCLISCSKCEKKCIYKPFPGGCGSEKNMTPYPYKYILSRKERQSRCGHCWLGKSYFCSRKWWKQHEMELITASIVTTPLLTAKCCGYEHGHGIQSVATPWCLQIWPAQLTNPMRRKDEKKMKNADWTEIRMKWRARSNSHTSSLLCRH